jgi:hypothetical protein
LRRPNIGVAHVVFKAKGSGAEPKLMLLKGGALLSQVPVVGGVKKLALQGGVESQPATLSDP